MGISRMIEGELNGLMERRGDNERSIEVLMRSGCGGGLIEWPLWSSGSGLIGISTIGLGDRWGPNSV